MKRVKIKWRGRIIEGLLLQSPDEKIYVVKLKSGYNVGILKTEAQIIEESEVADIKSKVMEEKNEEGEISILASGGTIASKIDYKTGAVYPSISGEELRADFPELDEIAKIDVRTILKIFSEEMQPEHWELISEEVFKEVKKNKGVVLLHGTDTMAYTASALSFAIDTEKPIVLTGAQRSSDRPSSDNKENLLNSVFSAKQDFGEVVVCMHADMSDGFGYLHRGVKVRKMHSSRRDAFKSINIRPLAKVQYKGVFEVQEPFIKAPKAELKGKFSRDVGLLYVYPGMKEDILNAFEGYRGLIIAGTGLGHISVSKLGEKLKKMIDDGMYVYMTTQTLYGRVNMNVYSTGRELQKIGVKGNYNDILPETAYVKLSWALANYKDNEKVDEIMSANLKGELSARSKIL